MEHHWLKKLIIASLLALPCSAHAGTIPPNCPTNSGSQALNYATATNAFSCNMVQTGLDILGTSASAAAPRINGDATTGFYTAGAGKVDVSISGNNIAEWTSGGVSVTGSMISSLGYYLPPQTAPSSPTPTGTWVLYNDTADNTVKLKKSDGTTFAIGSGTGTVNSGTAGQLGYYASTGTAISGNSSLIWDTLNSRLGVGTSSPSQTLAVNGSITAGLNGDVYAFAHRFTTTSTSITGTGMYNKVVSANGIAFALSGTDALDIFPGPLVGIGTTSPAATLDILSSSTQTASSASALQIKGAQSTANTGNFYGAIIAPTYTAASGNTLAGLYGAQAVPENSSTGAATNIHGFYSKPLNSSSGTVTNMYGVTAIPTKSGTGAVTTMYGLYSRCDNTGASGTVTNCYELYLGTPITTSAITNKYGVYQIDPNTTNYFAGSVGIGTTSSSSTLNVSGGVGIGTTYAGTAISSNTLAVQGMVGISSASPVGQLDIGGAPSANLPSLFIHPSGTANTSFNANSIQPSVTLSAATGAQQTIHIAPAYIPTQDFSSAITGIVNNVGMGVGATAAYNFTGGVVGFSNFMSVGNNYTGNVSSYVGFYGSDVFVSASTATLTRQAAIMVAPLTFATNNTALAIGVTSVPTGNYAIYNASANSNYFAGNLSIGTTTASVPLTVNGAASVGSLNVTSSSAPANGAYLPTTNTIGITNNSLDTARFLPVASAVDYLTFSGGKSGTNPKIAVAGSSPDQGIDINGKGAKGISNSITTNSTSVTGSNANISMYNLDGTADNMTRLDYGNNAFARTGSIAVANHSGAGTMYLQTATSGGTMTTGATLDSSQNFSLTNPLAVTSGGTGRATSTTAYGIIAAGTTATGNQQTISPGSTGQVLVSAGSSSLGAFEDYPAASSSWTPGYTGFSSNPTSAYAAYQRFGSSGKMIVVYYRDTANGTSNSTSYTITNLPCTASATMPPQPAICTDNGVQSACTIQISGTTATLTKGSATGGGGFTNSGNKSCGGFTAIYECQ